MKGVLAILLVVAVAVSAQPKPFRNLITLDCGGRAHLLGVNQVVRAGFQLRFLREFFDFVQGMIKPKAQCHCPTMSAQDIDTQFTFNFGNLLQRIEAKPGEPNFGSCSFQASLDKLAQHLHNFTLPNTCTSARYMNGEPCLIQYYLRPVDVYIQLAVAPCGTSNLPFISVSCSGNLCGDVWKPCNSDGECSPGSKCGFLSTSAQSDWSTTTNNILKDLKLYGNNEVADTGNADCDAPSAGFRKFNQVFQFFSNNMFGGTGTPNGLNFCGLNRNFSDIPESLKNDFKVDDEGLATNALLPWDGNMEGGGNVMDAAVKDGTGFTSLAPRPVAKDGPEVTIAVLDCDTSLTLFPDSPISFTAYGPTIHNLINHLKPIAKSLSDCRTTADLTNDQFDVRFNVFSPKFWMNMLTAHGAFFQGETFPNNPGSPGDPRRALHDNAFRIDDSTFEFLELPTTCTFEYWLQHGNCSVEYTGFRSLFNNDMAIRAIISKCPSGDGALPKFQLTCSGTSCHSMLEPYVFTYCRQDADCGTGSKCINVVPIMFPIAGKILWDVPTEKQDSVMAVFRFDRTAIDNNIPFGTTWWDNSTFEEKLVYDVKRYMSVDYWGIRPQDPIIRTTINHSNRNWLNNDIVVELFGTRHNRPYIYGGSSNWNAWGSALNTAGFATSLYSYGGSRYDECPDHSFGPTCTPDTCDNFGIMAGQSINFVRQLTGQSTVATDSSQTQGLCDNNLIRTLRDDAATKAWRDQVIIKSGGRTRIRDLNAKYAPPPPPPPSSASTSTVSFLAVAFAAFLALLLA